MLDKQHIPQDGEVIIHDVEVAQVDENRIYILDYQTQEIIGRAVSLKREPHSAYNWLLEDVCCAVPLPSEIAILIEHWTIDSTVFREGYGWLTESSREEARETERHDYFYVVATNPVIMPPMKDKNLYLYRYATLKGEH